MGHIISMCRSLASADASPPASADSTAKARIAVGNGS